MNFVAGLVAFLIGHLVFIAPLRSTACRNAGSRWRLPRRFPPQPRSFTGYTRTSQHRTCFQCLLMCGHHGDGCHGWKLIAGTTGKLILARPSCSTCPDIFVARWKYVSPGSINGLFCYPLYYSACLCFAWTVFLDLRNGAQRPPRDAKPQQGRTAERGMASRRALFRPHRRCGGSATTFSGQRLDYACVGVTFVACESLGAFQEIVGHDLSFLERPESFHLDRRVVYEDIRPAVASYESVAF